MKTTSNDQLLVGIDFGTFQTTIVTSRGEKIRFRSVVGYPKDIIAQKIMGKNFFVGEDVLQNRGSLSLTAPCEGDLLSYGSTQGITVANELLTYGMTQVKLSPSDKVYGLICVPALAHQLARNRLLDSAHDLFNGSALVSSSLAAAYGIGKQKNAIIIDIGGSSISICGLKGAIPGPDDFKTIPKAGYHIDHTLMEALEQKYPGVQLTRNMVRRIKEEHAFVGEPDRQVTTEFRTKGIPDIFDITVEIQHSCETILPELIDGLKEILSGFDIEQQDEALQSIYLCGGGSMIRGIAQYIAGEFEEYGDASVTAVEDPSFAVSRGALKLGESVDPGLWHKFGAAL